MTPRQSKILEMIYIFWKQNEYAPSLEEIKEHIKAGSESSVYHSIRNLEIRGYLTKLKHARRSIELTSKGISHFEDSKQEKENDKVEITKNFKDILNNFNEISLKEKSLNDFVENFVVDYNTYVVKNNHDRNLMIFDYSEFYKIKELQEIITEDL